MFFPSCVTARYKRFARAVLASKRIGRMPGDEEDMAGTHLIAAFSEVAKMSSPERLAFRGSLLVALMNWCLSPLKRMRKLRPATALLSKLGSCFRQESVEGFSA
jgi:hypothetical protein